MGGLAAIKHSLAFWLLSLWAPSFSRSNSPMSIYSPFQYFERFLGVCGCCWGLWGAAANDADTSLAAALSPVLQAHGITSDFANGVHALAPCLSFFLSR